ncbi:nucleoside monophosphate kinase [Dactylosporangium cerinum]|uniref:Nucleoside monophosphate kinase n=1 Tax=Dactylosporangium cerinum TaxID=1434730 RepID=A0ABV9VVR5_9ACTN
MWPRPARALRHVSSVVRTVPQPSRGADEPDFQQEGFELRGGERPGVRAHLDRGELVPDEIIMTMIREALAAAKAAGGGYVLDGVPRTMEQARATYEIGRELGMTADVALHLRAADEELLRARAVVERHPTTPRT